MATQGCEEAVHLFEVYAAALNAFHAVKNWPPRDRLAFATLVKARGQYWKHIQMHGCRGVDAADIHQLYNAAGAS